MAKIEEGKKIPDFSFSATNSPKQKLSEFLGKNIVLYFYPKDNTAGCTREGQDFRDKYKTFTRNNTVVFGISRDKLTSHERFKDKQKFPFDLIADEDEKLCKLFDVIKMKNMYGKKVRGIERSTFLIDSKGVLRREWRKVKVDGHIDAVIEEIKNLKK